MAISDYVANLRKHVGKDLPSGHRLIGIMHERAVTAAQIDQICVSRAPLSCTGSAAPQAATRAMS